MEYMVYTAVLVTSFTIQVQLTGLSWVKKLLSVSAIGFGWAGRVVMLPDPGGSHLSAGPQLAHLGVDELMLMITIEVSAHPAALALDIGGNNHPNRVSVNKNLQFHERLNNKFPLESVNLELVVLWCLLVPARQFLVGGIVVGFMFIHGDNLSIKGDLILGMGDRLDEDLKSSNVDHDIHLWDNVVGKRGRLLHEDCIGGDGSAVRGDQSPAVVHFIGIGDIVKGPDGSGGGSTVTNDIVGNHGMSQGGNMRVS